MNKLSHSEKYFLAKYAGLEKSAGLRRGWKALKNLSSTSAKENSEIFNDNDFNKVINLLDETPADNSKKLQVQRFADDQPIEDYEKIYEQYANAFGRRRSNPTDPDFLIDTWAEKAPHYVQNGNNYLLGYLNHNIFTPSHFAPETTKGGYNLLKKLRSDVPTTFAVPEDLGKNLSSLGYKKLPHVYKNLLSSAAEKFDLRALPDDKELYHNLNFKHFPAKKIFKSFQEIMEKWQGDTGLPRWQQSDFKIDLDADSIRDTVSGTNYNSDLFQNRPLSDDILKKQLDNLSSE